MKRRAHPAHYEAIATEAGVGVDTVARVYDGKPTRPTTHEAVRQAAILLRLPEPPEWRHPPPEAA